MSDLTARITEIQRDHWQLGSDDEWVCALCGSDFHTQRTHREHLSELIAQAAEDHYRPRIEKPEQLAALPIGSVVAHTESRDDRTEYRKFGPYVWGKFGDSCMYSAPPIYKHTPLRLLWSPGTRR